MQKITTKKITTLAMMLGILIVFKLLEGAFFKMPQGGSLSISSVIFILFMMYISFSESVILFLLWRIVILLFSPPFIVSPIQFILEYFITYSGFLLIYPLVKQEKVVPAVIGSVIANILRYIMHGLAGVIFFAEYATGPVWQYSFGYNLTYMLPTLLLHIFILVVGQR